MCRMYLLVVLVLMILTAISISAQTAGGPSEKEVEYANGEIKLFGTVMVPEGKGPFPAVVLIHGSGTSDRGNAWTSAYAKALVARGIAVLHPDKRGSGKSTGDWSKASFDDLAKDAVAAVEVLKADPRIDKSMIGLMGFSQGGHIAPIAAQAPDVAFVVNVSGSVVPMFEQIEDEIISMARRAGLTAVQIEQVKDINRKAIEYLSTGNGRQQYLDALTAAAGELKDHPIIRGFPTDPNHPRAVSAKSIGNFDPMPYWQKLAIPIAFVYGGQDTQVNVTKSVRRIDEGLGPQKKNYTLLVMNGNGHGVFREDVTAFLAEWIKNKGRQ